MILNELLFFLHICIKDLVFSTKKKTPQKRANSETFKNK